MRAHPERGLQLNLNDLQPAGDLLKERLYFPKKESADGWHSRGYIPHFDAQGVTQHLNFRLWDSLPQEVLARWEEELRHLPAKEFELARRIRIEAYLDQGYGCCYLCEPTIAALLENALLHFDGERYFLHAWCIMPNHVHVLFTPATGYDLSKIEHSWKSYTATQANRLLQRTGSFWQRDPFDRYIRNERHFENAVAYIENNPVKAGLCAQPQDWQWSSARRRKQ